MSFAVCRMTRLSLCRPAIRSSVGLSYSVRCAARVHSSARVCSEPVPLPEPDGSDDKIYPEHLHDIVGKISQLNLLEVQELNELLRKTLKIVDAPVMMAAGVAPASAPVEDDEPQVQQVQTNFTVKLLSFDDAKKIPLIKELKNCVEGMNLVQAKKFVESAPVVVQADINKEEADKLKKLLEDAGGKCEVL